MAPRVTVVVVVAGHQNLGAHARFAQDQTKKDLEGVDLINIVIKKYLVNHAL